MRRIKISTAIDLAIATILGFVSALLISVYCGAETPSIMPRSIDEVMLLVQYISTGHM